MFTRMKLTSTFSETEITKDVPYEFTVVVNPNDDLGKEINQYIYFSKRPLLLEQKLGDNWIEVTTNFPKCQAIEETLEFRVIFSETVKVKMCFYCMSDGKYLTDVIQYNTVLDKSSPVFDTNLPDIVSINTETEFEVNIHPNDYDGKVCKIQYVFNSMDSVKRIEQYVDNPESEYNGKYIVVDKSDFISGELRTLTEETVKFKVIFLAYGAFKLYVLVNGFIQYTKNFIVESPTLDPIPVANNIEVVCVDKPDNSKIEIKDNKINFIYSDIMKNDYWQKQWKKHSGNASPNDIYCGIQFICPLNVSHYRIVTESLSGTYYSNYNEIIPADCNSIVWYFPVARKINGVFKELDYFHTGTYYNFTVYFYNYTGREYVEVFSGTYNIKCKFRVAEPTNISQFSSELIYYVKMLLNGCTVQTAIKTYGLKNNWDNSYINDNIIKYCNNFGLFALDTGLLHNSNEVEAVNYIIHRKNGDLLHRLGIYRYNPENEFVKKLVYETLGKNIKDSKHFVCYENLLKK